MLQIPEYHNHKTISYSSLERNSLTVPQNIVKLFDNSPYYLEFGQWVPDEGSEDSRRFRYSLHVYLPLLNSRYLKYLINEFEDRTAAEDLYKKILDVVKEGGKILLGSSPLLMNSNGKLVNMHEHI